MAVHVGRVRAPVVGTIGRIISAIVAAVGHDDDGRWRVDRTTVISVGILIGSGAVLRCSDRNAGADNAGESGCGSGSAAIPVPSARERGRWRNDTQRKRRDSCKGDRSTGECLISSQLVDAVSLTGSERAGRAALSICASRGVPVQAELGGNNSAIVWSVADLEGAAADILRRRDFDPAKLMVFMPDSRKCREVPVSGLPPTGPAPA